MKDLNQYVDGKTVLQIILQFSFYQNNFIFKITVQINICPHLKPYI